MSNVPVRVFRQEIYDLRRREFIDMVIPTIEVKRTGISRSVANNGVIGSHRVGPGSLFRLTEVEVFSGSVGAIVGVASTGTPLTPQEQRGTSLIYNAPKVLRAGTPLSTTQNPGLPPNHIVYRWDNAPAFGAGTLNFKNVSGATGSPFIAVSFRGYEYSLSQGLGTT
jgi:hypothetical protein